MVDLCWKNLGGAIGDLQSPHLTWSRKSDRQHKECLATEAEMATLGTTETHREGDTEEMIEITQTTEGLNAGRRPPE